MGNNSSDQVAISEARMGMETPMVISHIAKNCLYTGFFGRLDSVRIKSITDKIISKAESSDTLITIIDLGNVEVIDTSICQHLLDIGVTMRTLGVKVVFCSIKSIVAQTMTKAGIRFTDFDVYKNLEVALNAVYDQTGYRLSKIKA